MRVTVLGSGRWGTFQAWYAARCGHDVVLWGRPESKDMLLLKQNRVNSYLELPKDVHLTTDLTEAISHGELLNISISAQALRMFCVSLSTFDLSQKALLLCMKGLEQETGKRLTQVVQENFRYPLKIAVLVGPGHVQSYIEGVPGAMVVDSEDNSLKADVVETLSSELIRLYLGDDLIGTEIGAAAKNVIGLAAGMLDGYGYTSLKGALIARGAREVARLIKAMGGSELSAYGLSHLGDYEATLFSPYSQNRMFGETFVRKEVYSKLAEGVYTVNAMMQLAKTVDVDLPISSAVQRILYNQADPKHELTNLFLRSVKSEFV